MEDLTGGANARVSHGALTGNREAFEQKADNPIDDRAEQRDMIANLQEMLQARWLLVLGIVCLAHSCSSAQPRQGHLVPGTTPKQHDTSIPQQGSDATLDVASWNLDWFGDSIHGPADEPLQLDRVQAVIAGTDADIWGLVEVVGGPQWNALRARLNGYAGILANDGDVVDGSRYYDDTEQRPGVLYKASMAALEDARLIVTDHEADFAGRPPLQVTLQVSLGAVTERAVFIIIHPKCCSDEASWQRRVNASSALKTYIDATLPLERVWVIGDFNDDVDTSIVEGHTSPYFNFTIDPSRYSLPTQSLSLAHVTSTVEYPEMIDHHLITNEVSDRYVAQSVAVLRVDEYIEDYAATTSDHYPILSQYEWSRASADKDGAGDNTWDTRAPIGGAVIINEVGANEPGSETGAEFVELVNTGTAPADIAGWTIRDGSGVRHTFAANASVGACSALVVFADSAAIPAALDNAIAASTGALSLANGGDWVTLADSKGVVTDHVTYMPSLAEQDGVSMNRSPDATPGAPFAVHTALSALTASPGKRVNGSNW
jgi:endonuclease/exonuclease/phosphatase family metal-dependent hydrolase